MPTSFIAQDIMAEHLLSHNAIVFLKDKPMRLRSGLVTPIYVDNRILPSYPEAWRDIVETMASRIDGIDVKGKKVLIIEDHLSTGLSLLDAAKVLREAGAIVEACFAITNFDMPETMRNFEKHHITAYQLLPFAFIVEKAEKLGLIDANEKEQIDAWLDTPWTWAAERGLFAQASEN